MPEYSRKLKVGRLVDLPDKAKKLQEKYKDRGFNRRSTLDKRLKDFPVEPANENIQSNTMVGAAVTYGVAILSDYLPTHIAADTEIVNISDGPDGAVTYTIDVNAPLEGQARFESVMQAGTGLTSLWTDDIEVNSIDVKKKRVFRDTYRYDVTIK